MTNNGIFAVKIGRKATTDVTHNYYVKNAMFYAFRPSHLPI